jgi:hypothetical protein
VERKLTVKECDQKYFVLTERLVGEIWVIDLQRSGWFDDLDKACAATNLISEEDDFRSCILKRETPWC